MRQRGMGLALVIMLAAGMMWAGCGGDGGPPEIEAGAAVVERSDTQVTVRGKVAFTDANGAPVAMPAGGALCVVGTGSRAISLNSKGEFTLSGLPVGQPLSVKILAVGFLLCQATIPVAANSLPAGTLRCVQDTNSTDNPSVQNPNSFIDPNGALHFTCSIPANTELLAFHVAGDMPASGQDKTLSDVPNPQDTLPVEYQAGPNNTRLCHVQVSYPLATGRLFFCPVGPGGVEVLKFGTCGLNLVGYSRPVPTGRTVSGRITDNIGAAAGGAEVLVWDPTAPSTNRANDTAGSTSGSFSVDLPSPPAGTNPAVIIHVQWRDPATGRFIVCVFTGN